VLKHMQWLPKCTKNVKRNSDMIMRIRKEVFSIWETWLKTAKKRMSCGLFLLLIRWLRARLPHSRSLCLLPNVSLLITAACSMIQHSYVVALINWTSFPPTPCLGSTDALQTSHPWRAVQHRKSDNHAATHPSSNLHPV
jgi:hypothetical protein